MTAKEDITDRRIATPEQRIMASNITQARKGKSGWESYEKDMKVGITESLAGAVDVVLVTEQGDEVLAIVESEPTQAIDWVLYRKDHPELEQDPEFRRKYLKPATTKTTFYTKWVEQAPAPEESLLPATETGVV